MVEIPWYNYSEEDRIINIYSKFTIQQFWDWWSDGQGKTMEVRIKDFNVIKEVAHDLQYLYSASGIYVADCYQLKKVLSRVRNTSTIWFGVNPRKRNWNKWGNKSFGGFDTNVQEIAFVFIDIDRMVKEGPATKIDLENCDRLANHIIERLGVEKWNLSYCKICSGNGVQLLLKLDFPIKVPEQVFDSATKMWIPNNEYEKIKLLISKGIGADIKKFSSAYKDLQVEIDKSGFNLSRVAALPFSKNFKYEGFTWRGIVELHTGVNEGFSDYILSKELDIKTYTSMNVFKASKSLLARDRIKAGHIKENVLIKFMLDNNLPAGMRNNYLWFQAKCLLRDSKIDVTTDEFKEIHRVLEKKYGSLPTNVPDDKFAFDENIVNKYCIENMIPPLYPLWPKRTKKLNMMLDTLDWSYKDIVDEKIVLPVTTTVLEDLESCKKQLVEGSRSNANIVASFINGLIVKYGEQKTQYIFDYVLIRCLSYE